MFHRAITEHVLEDLQLFPVIGIIGPRQVGKTTLAKYLRDKIGRDTLYLDLELNTDRNTLSEAEIFLKFHQEKCIIIDEIQHMPELFPLPRVLIDMDRQQNL